MEKTDATTGVYWPPASVALASGVACVCAAAYGSHVLLDWLGDAAMARRILVDNPARLFGFDD